jgi:hypothetical protein
MQTVTLLEKLYGKNEEHVLSYLVSLLKLGASNLNLSLNVLGKNSRNWIKVGLSGEDSTVMINYLNKIFGLAPTDLNKIHLFNVVRGKVIDSGKVGYGVYVDIGIEFPKPIDALIPLYKLRQQLVKNNQLSCRTILDLYCLYDNFPLEVNITRLDPNLQLIEAEFSDNQLSIFKDWVKLGLDRLIILGKTLEQVKQAIQKGRVQRDIAKVEQLGLLEHVIVCTLGTNARGLITKLGPFLPHCPLYIFNPEKVRAFMLK